MRYEGTVYRPPSEAGSLIIQLTIGCARNTCTFCNMYKDKKFRIRPLEEVVEDLEMARSYYSRIKVRRIFLEAGKKVRAAGMILSMTVISGLGGKKLWREHALGSARVISAIKPEYVGFLTLMIEPGTEMYDQYNRGEIELLTPHEVLDETELFIRSVDAEGTMFRSNHASNYIPLGGTLNGERDKILEQIEISRRKSKFRPDVFRGI